MYKTLIILVVGLTALVSSVAVACGGQEPAPRPVEPQAGPASTPPRVSEQGERHRGDRDDRGDDDRDDRGEGDDDRDDRGREDRDDRDDDRQDEGGDRGDDDRRED